MIMQNRAIASLLLGGLLFGLPAYSEAQSGAKVNNRRQPLNGFDVSNAVIPTSEMRSGGPPRDGIPAIDRPRFLRARQVNYLSDDDLVVSVTLDGKTRAYPLRILVRHEIVNDRIGQRAFAVTYCPLCGTAMVFDRSVGGRTRSFGVSGLLYRSDVLMYDRESESLFSQLAMKAVAGPLADTPLEWLPSEHMTWPAWRQRYPYGEVLSNRSGRNYSHNPYEGYDQSSDTAFPVPLYRSELPKKSWVFGVIVGEEAKAYSVAQLPPNQVVSDSVGGQEVHVAYDPAGRQPSVVRTDTGEPVPYVMVYWFAWQAFYPETLIWTP